MPNSTIDYYFTMTSPWAYLGHDHLMAMARRTSLMVRFRPVALGEVFPQTGGLPLAKRHPARQAYRFLELQRWRQKRGLALNLRPKYFPMDPSLADRSVLALMAAKGDVAGFMAALFRATFAEERDGANPQVLGEILAACGADATAILAHAASDTLASHYHQDSLQAIAAGVFGSPTYVRDGELFFGQDRLELLEDAILSGRAGYRV